MRRSIRWCLEQGLDAVTTSLVTGGNGYFGPLLVDRLRRRAATACACSTSTSDGRRRPGVEVVAGDIRDAGRRARSAVDGVDVVYHNVAQVPLARDPDAAALGQRRRHGGRCSTPAATPASARSCTRRRARCSASPSRNPVLPTTVPKPQEAYGHAKLAAEWACLRGRRRRASTSRSSGRARSSATAGSASSGSCSTGSPTAPTRSCSATAPTATSSSTPTTSPTVCLARRRRARARRSSTSAPTASARCARRSSTCARTPAPAPRVRSLPGGAGGAGDAGQRRASASPRSPRTTG